MTDNENLIPIPGRLHSVATEGHVSGADEIYDDVQQKNQETINSELIEAIGTGGSVDTRIANAVNVEKTRAEGAESTLDSKITAEQTRATNTENALDDRVDTLEEAVGTGGSVDSRIASAVATETSRAQGAESTLQTNIDAEATRAQAAEADRYTKSETYTKEEVHNLITTPNQKYASVTATTQTTVVTDVLPVTGAADTIYRVGNWDGTQYNDSVFSEYAWDDSAYIKLSTKSQVGEVYDVSANHADAKYTDLAAALGVNGANIPQSLQKGGMSIKFVQSSDNKYVQYRLMADAFSTTISDWRNLDSEITDLDLKVDSTRVDLVSEILRKQNNPISDNNNHTLSICDEKGNIIAHIQSGVDIDSFGNIITKLFDSSHTISDNKGGYTIKNKNGDIVFKVSNKSTLLNDVFSNDKNICVTDAEGNIIAKISKNGTETTNAKTNNIFSYDKLIICDEKGNISLSIDKETTQLNKLKAKYLQVNKIDILDNNDKSVPTIGIDDKFETDFVGVYMYGQSLGNGCYSGNVVSTVCPYKNLFSFKGGVRTYDSFYLNHSRHTWINRKGDVKYGELIDYKNTLSDIDIAAINDSYSELIPLVQKIQMYSPYTNEIYPDISYKANNKGGTYMQHVAGEVPMSGILEVFDMLLIDEDKYNIDNKMLNFIGGCPDYGSATFLSMLPLDCGGITQGPTQMQETETVPDINWFEMLSLDVYKAKEYCDSIGKTYSVSALFYYHEGDFDETSIMISKSARLRLFTRINDRIKEITGQENDVIFIMHQSHMSLTHNKIDMQLGLETEPNVYTSEQEIRLKNAFDAVKPDGGVSLYDTPEYDKNKIYLGQPIYGYKYADSIHLTSEYSKRHGAAMGYVYKRVVVDGKDWKPIHPLSHKVSQVVIDGVSYYKTSVKFHLDVAPLILDDNAINGTQTSVTATNRGDKYGFIFANQDGTLHGKDGNNEDFIKKIEVVKGNTINFYTIDNTVGMNLHYAIDFTKAENSYLDGNARVNRPIGNLRDSRGTYYKVHINDKIGDVPIDNWCPSFIYNIN